MPERVLWLSPPFPRLGGPCDQIDAMAGQKVTLAAKAVNAERASVMVRAKRSNEPVVAAGRFALSSIENVMDFGRTATGKAPEAGDPVVILALLLCLARGLGLHALVRHTPFVAARGLPLPLQRGAPHQAHASGFPKSTCAGVSLRTRSTASSKACLNERSLHHSSYQKRTPPPVLR